MNCKGYCGYAWERAGRLCKHPLPEDWRRRFVRGTVRAAWKRYADNQRVTTITRPVSLGGGGVNRALTVPGPLYRRGSTP